MLPSLFDYSDYKEFVRDAIASYPAGGRGLRKDLAFALRVQLPFISHVLNGEQHFSVEQGYALAKFFNLSDDESEFLIFLILKNRSGSQEFSRFLDKKLKSSRKTNNLQNTVKIEASLSPLDQAVYYGHWSYSAVHMALTLPSCRRKEEIASYLQIPLAQTSNILEFLVRTGIASQTKGIYKAENVYLYLSHDSELLPRYHRTLRDFAAEKAVNRDKDNMHYSSLVSCSRDDFPKVRKVLEKALKECVDLIKRSPEEELATLNIDWFGVKGGA